VGTTNITSSFPFLTMQQQNKKKWQKAKQSKANEILLFAHLVG
jgi:hypothetical protein